MASFLELLAQQAGGGMNFTGGPQPYQPIGPRDFFPDIRPGSPFPVPQQPEPMAQPVDPEEEKANARRDLIREEAWKLYTGEGPKRPDTKLTWREMLAASLKPEWLPMIMQRKMEPYLTEIESKREKGANLRTLAGLYPEEKAGAYNLGPGGVLVNKRGRELYRNPNAAGAGKRDFTVKGKGRYEIGPDGKPRLLVGEDGGGAGDKLPAYIVNRAVRKGVNPYSSEHPFHALIERVIASGTDFDEGQQEATERIYIGAINKLMEQGADLNDVDYQQAADFAVKVGKATPRVGPQPQGQGGIGIPNQGYAPGWNSGGQMAPGWAAPGGMPASPGGYAPGMTNEAQPTDLSPEAKALYFRLRDLGASAEDAERAAMAEDAKRTRIGAPAISP